MLTTFVNAVRAVPFWTLMVLCGVLMLVYQWQVPMGIVVLLTGVYGWRQKYRIYRSLRQRFKTQGGFHAASYEGYYHTWCERMALYQAARESGHYDSAYYHGRHVMGYTLWHILPRL